MRGRNTGRFADYVNNDLADGAPAYYALPWLNAQSGGGGMNVASYGGTGKTYGGMLWAGLPFKITALEPLNIEVDLKLRFCGGKWAVLTRMVRNNSDDIRRGSTQRQGLAGEDACGIQQAGLGRARRLCLVWIRR